MRLHVGEPRQRRAAVPRLAPTNKRLAESNKSRTGGSGAPAGAPTGGIGPSPWRGGNQAGGAFPPLPLALIETGVGTETGWGLYRAPHPLFRANLAECFGGVSPLFQACFRGVSGVSPKAKQGGVSLGEKPIKPSVSGVFRGVSPCAAATSGTCTHDLEASFCKARSAVLRAPSSADWLGRRRCRRVRGEWIGGRIPAPPGWSAPREPIAKADATKSKPCCTRSRFGAQKQNIGVS